MSKILTFVASDIPLEEGHIGSYGAVKWLSEGKAADVVVDGEVDVLAIRAAMVEHRVDVFVSDADSNGLKGRRKKLLLADMDSTIVAEETLDELAGFAGLKEQVAEITAKAMNGELDFHGAIRERVKKEQYETWFRRAIFNARSSDVGSSVRCETSNITRLFAATNCFGFCSKTDSY